MGYFKFPSFLEKWFLFLLKISKLPKKNQLQCVKRLYNRIKTKKLNIEICKRRKKQRFASWQLKEILLAEIT
jgi:hypothetical protein